MTQIVSQTNLVGGKDYGPTSAQWKQIYSLIFLEVAVIISWIAYHNYQIQLLKTFELTSLTIEILVIQAVILLVTPPIAGHLADKLRRRGRDRLPLIKLGINLVAMVFMAAALTIFTEPGGTLRFILPVLIVFWLILMNVFYSPAIATIELFVPSKQLPIAMAVLAIMIDLAQALEPSLQAVIEFLGAPLTFAAGGALVFASGWYFRKTTKEITDNNPDAIGEEDINAKVDGTSFPKVFFYGVIFGLCTAIFFEYFPGIADKRTGYDGSIFTSILIAFSALLAYPASKLIKEGTIKRYAIIGGVACLALGALVLYGPEGDWVNFAFYLYPIFFALISVALLPLAFAQLQPAYKILGIGLFFAGLELPNSIAKIIQNL